jgi:ADP-ribose pyrophosphatase YjhB (NUDIX family)
MTGAKAASGRLKVMQPFGEERAPASRSGDGFVTVADGTARWGRFGAAGVLVRCANADGTWSYFLARRSEWCHQGGCWAVPGGALMEGEAPLEGARREFAEEIGDVLGEGFRAVDVHEDDHGGWSYWTIVVEVAEPFAVPATVNWETAEAGWIPHARLSELELLGAFRRTLVRLGILGEVGP